MTDAPTPQRHVAASYERPRCIVVGVDGSVDAAHAMAWAATLASAVDAEVVAVHAVGLLSVIDGQVRPSDQVRDALARQVTEWATPLIDSGARHRIVLEDGPPGLVLLRVAEREHAGLIVSGTRGLGSADGALLGSTSHHLLRFSRVPVVVVPHLDI
ncbi:MAG: universal stress protein [Acidimicrobiia bacterium]|nr:universal stress protein [Acidimicrobiia bacterium]